MNLEVNRLGGEFQFFLCQSVGDGHLQNVIARSDLRPNSSAGPYEVVRIKLLLYEKWHGLGGVDLLAIAEQAGLHFQVGLRHGVGLCI